MGMIDGPNTYLYCSNNPVGFIDPWGLCGEDSIYPTEKMKKDFEEVKDWYRNYQKDFDKELKTFTYPTSILEKLSPADKLDRELLRLIRKYGPWVVWWGGRIYYNFELIAPIELYPPPPGWTKEDWYNYDSDLIL